MSSGSDLYNTLAEIYVMIQELTHQHKTMCSALKELDYAVESSDTFVPIENSAISMIETCKKMKNHLTPKPMKNCCCH